MKALEILNDMKLKYNSHYIKGNNQVIKLDEAIEELKELKNRSCATCKYGRSFHFDKDIECMKLYDATQGLCFEKDFYCKNWEQKKNERY